LPRKISCDRVTPVVVVKMKIVVHSNAEEAAIAAAKFIAEQARSAVAARGRFVLALSAGHSPAPMLRALAEEDLPWEKVYFTQVDERVAPAGHPDRNLTTQLKALGRAPLLPDHFHPMPVEAPDLASAAEQYAQTLGALAGSPPVLDLAHLGIGTDGHTASLVPDDPVTGVTSTDVALTGVYQSRRRMTLTFPMLNRSRSILWLITGSEKAAMLARLHAADTIIPAGKIRQDRAMVFADQAAAEVTGAGRTQG
jgi:6-phosphogluconolactonase